jgi:hypothetical protein
MIAQWVILQAIYKAVNFTHVLCDLYNVQFILLCIFCYSCFGLSCVSLGCHVMVRITLCKLYIPFNYTLFVKQLKTVLASK